MTDIERAAAVKISRDLCLSCVYKTNMEEYPLLIFAHGGREPFLYCKALSARAVYDRLTGKCTCTSFQKKGATNG